jgi:hypothetical protein
VIQESSGSEFIIRVRFESWLELLLGIERRCIDRLCFFFLDFLAAFHSAT